MKMAELSFLHHHSISSAEDQCLKHCLHLVAMEHIGAVLFQIQIMLRVFCFIVIGIRLLLMGIERTDNQSVV